MLYVNRGIGQFLKRLGLIIAAKRGHAEHCVRVFNMTTPYRTNSSDLPLQPATRCTTDN